MFIFEIPGSPISQKQTAFRRFGDKILTYDPSKKDKEKIQWQVKPFAPREVLCGPIAMQISFYLSIPKATSSVRRRQMENGMILPVVKPDIDNLAYLITNALKGIVYKDDNQICMLKLLKYFSINPRTEIKVSQMDPLELVGNYKS